jgi:hypothetical protein
MSERSKAPGLESIPFGWVLKGTVPPASRYPMFPDYSNSTLTWSLMVNPALRRSLELFASTFWTILVL